MIPIRTTDSACTPRPAGEALARASANAHALRPDAAALAAARRVLADSADCASPVADARLLPNAAYNDADFWRFERHALFEREWLFVGHVSQVPAPGDHLAVRILDEPLLIVRDQDGTLRVLSAICQHRGHPLMDGLAAPADPTRCSNAKLLVCPYHSWSYKLDGRLHSAPAMGRTTPIAALREDVRLPVIRSEIVHGLIFVNFADDAPPLAPRLAKFDAAVRHFDIANLVATPTVTTGPHRWNWKIYQENSLEPYHTDYVHRDSHNPAPANLSAFYPFDEGDGQIVTTTGFSGESGELFDAEGKVQLPAIEGLTAEEHGRLLFISVMPVLFMVLEAGSVLVTMALPQDADHTELRMFSLHPKAATEVDGFDDVQAAQLRQLLAIVGEDLTTQEALHRGHRSRFSPPGRLSWLEATLPQMNQWLLERYRAAYAALTDPGTAA